MKTKVKLHRDSDPQEFNHVCLVKVEGTKHGTRYEVFQVQNFGDSCKFLVYKVKYEYKKTFKFFGSTYRIKTYQHVCTKTSLYAAESYIGDKDIKEQEFLINVERCVAVGKLED